MNYKKFRSINFQVRKQSDAFSKKLEEGFYKKDFFFLFWTEEMRKKK